MNIHLPSARTRWLAAGLLILAASIALIVGIRSAGAGARVVAFTDARLKIDVNGTDGDAGLQFFVDGPAWREVTITDPNGREVISAEVGSAFENYGLTELFFESSEPAFEVFPFEQFKRLFPEGRYTFTGTSIAGARMTGRFTLSHRVPDAPVILSPADDSSVEPTELVVEWEPVTAPAGIDIAGYQVLVVIENPLRVFSADLPSTATSISIPAEFLERGDYKAEVLAIEANANQTLSEVAFTVE